MKSKASSTNNLSWNSGLQHLSTNPKKPTKSIQKLMDANICSIKDLVWILPLRINVLPKLQEFSKIKISEYFKGRATVINIDLKPSFGKRGKNKVQLYNITASVKDTFSNGYLNLKWFNAYPNIKKQLEQIDEFEFLGSVTEYNSAPQIINPTLNPKSEEDLLKEYPTINGVTGNNLKKIIEKVPKYIWETPLYYFSEDLACELKTQNLNEILQTMHGFGDYSKKLQAKAKEHLIYFEFIRDQLKVTARKMAIKNVEAQKFKITKKSLKNFIRSFPYKLTDDQNTVIDHLLDDFNSGHPMMRIVQGDVGCGKTTISQVAALIILENNAQVALMCPTEALATQHYNSFKELFSNKYKVHYLLGSMKSKEKKETLSQLENGEIDIIIGTHSLFQSSVIFKNLKLAIIDEQHKFGVEQRLKLMSKGNATHTLLMSATPIPRTLQLAQYGDLDISTIKTIPPGRKGTKTRIVRQDNYEKYLSFIMTRVKLGEQVYIVVPAITESETLDIKNVEELSLKYKQYFPNLAVSSLHGQLKPQDKHSVMQEFEKGNIDILISTSVIEVGINVLNSTVMSIYNPERFGLSSLHQLRGRVGRGEKPGFCFLIPDNKLSFEALNRLKVIEKSNDGFEIAEADLKNRGEGDLFGTDQSGNLSSFKVASIFENFDLFQKSQDDVTRVKENKPELFNPLIEELIKDKKISTTI